MNASERSPYGAAPESRDVEQVLARKQGTDLPQDGKTTDTRIENTDGSLCHGDHFDVGGPISFWPHPRFPPPGNDLI